jgi:hypothetical protein
MARKTVAQQRQDEAAMRLLEFRELEATLPKQLFNLQVRASKLSWLTMLTLTPVGYTVEFLNGMHDSMLTVEMPVRMGDTEQWQLDNVAHVLKLREDELAEEAAKRDLASTALAKLTKEERAALRQHYNFL